VGTWSVALYGSDITRDLRDDLQRIVRAPWDGDDIRAWVTTKYPSLVDATDDDHTDVTLVLADQFWRFGIEHGETLWRALEVVAGGEDLERKRALGMSEKDIARRANLLNELAAKLAQPNSAPKNRRILRRPERFVLEVGDCLVYPTSDGDPRNPYVSAAREEAFYAIRPWEQTGWGSAIVLSRSHHFAVFARYVVAFLASGTDAKPSVEEMRHGSLRRFDEIRFVPAGDRFHAQSTPRPCVFAVTASRTHLARMRVEIVGRVAIDHELVAAEFDPDVSRISRFGVQALVRHASSGRNPDVDGPVGRYLLA